MAKVWRYVACIIAGIIIGVGAVYIVPVGPHADLAKARAALGDARRTIETTRARNIELERRIGIATGIANENAGRINEAIARVGSLQNTAERYNAIIGTIRAVLADLRVSIEVGNLQKQLANY